MISTWSPILSLKESTLIDLLHMRAERQPDQLAYTFLVDGESEELRLTYAELDRRARMIGAQLQDAGASGGRAVLLYPPGLDYIAAFFGCLYGGVVAIPAYPPNPAQLNRSLSRFQTIMNDAQPTLVLTTAAILTMVQAVLAQVPDMHPTRWMATDDLDERLADSWQPPAVGDDTLAFLQYTSGSTAAPKGVMLTHGNLLHNSALIYNSFEHSESSRGVIWLPPYHDMGLIGGILQPLYAGFPVVLMSPIAFLQRPLRWLQAISRYRATTSGGPNFAYDLCVRKTTPEQRAALDLSSWRVAFNGAEPIHPEVLDRFMAAFAPCGFRREAFYPCYGLAEATLIVSGGRAGDPPVVQSFEGAALEQHHVAAASSEDAGARALVGCGQAAPDHRIVIVQPESLAASPPDQVGEIWVAGPSVAQGYWKRPEETTHTFHATLADGAGPFLRTGDLGFVRDGELFITGRLKDLIIIRGRNHYPQDIELTVGRSHPALRPGNGAAFAVDVGGEERLVVVQELDRQHQKADVEAVASALRQAVAEQHEVQAYAVVLLKTGSIPKTSSGKIQRHACRAAFLANTLEAIGTSTVADDDAVESDGGWTREAFLAVAPEERSAWLERYLHAQVARVLGVAPARVDPRQPPSTHGLDSLMAIELQHDIETTLGVALPMVSVLQSPNLAQLAAEILVLASAPHAETMRALDRADGVEFPLSPGQRALWLVNQLAPESPVYNISSAVRISTEVDVPALRRAFQALVDRHPALRTTFVNVRGEPMQRVREREEVCFQEVDASAWSEAFLAEQLAAEVHRPFDLEQGPLLRLHLFSQSAYTHILLLGIHHIVADLWSLAVLTRELGLCYTAEKTSEPIALAPLTASYADHVRWQAELLASPRGEQLAAYWQQQLAAAPPVLSLPTDRPRPPVQSFKGTVTPFRLGAQLSRRIKACAEAAEATPFMILLAAFQVLLYRYSDQEDILVGSPTAGRGRAELSNSAGYFINPVVLRANLSGNPGFDAFLRQVRQTVLAAFAHQDYPFATLVERLQPNRDLSRSPIFQAVFFLQKVHLRDDEGVTALALGHDAVQMEIGGLRIEPVEVKQQTAQFDLMLAMGEVNGELAGSFRYSTDLFDEAMISRMTRHLLTLFESIVADPRESIATLSILDQAERRQLLLEWPANEKEYQLDQCLHEVFEARVERNPDAIAVVFGERTTNDHRPPTNDHRGDKETRRQGDKETRFSTETQPPTPNTQHPTPNTQQLTYRELNQRANQVAQVLLRSGVRPEVRVGVCMDRSLELVIALLATLKAGGGYVPLDPTYPTERLSFMLEDSSVVVLLTVESLLPHLPLEGKQVFCLDSDWDQIAQEAAENPGKTTTLDNLAYMIYTSGSTGRPKGTVIDGRSFLNMCLWYEEDCPITERSNVLLIISMSFDASIKNIIVPLFAGGKVILANPGYYDPARLLNIIDDQRVTTINITPSMMYPVIELSAAIEYKSIASIEYLGLGGEKMLMPKLKAWLSHPNCRSKLANVYGPTECTDVSACCDMRPDEIDISGSIPIGRPVHNALLYILDRHGNLQPTGLAGELCVSGAGLARGYHQRPDLTAVKFVPNPFGGVLGDGCWVTGAESFNTQHPTPNTRLYRTGDLTRWLPDGRIEFLGRIDQQVKVRGLRIELGEIESALSRHPSVRESAVVVQEGIPGDQGLIAYVVPTNDQRPTTNDQHDDPGHSSPALSPVEGFVVRRSSFVDELRAHLKGYLPEYMVPSAFVLLDSLPLSPNGKLDRWALKQLDPGRVEVVDSFVMPQNDVEQTIATVWQEVLQLEKVSTQDNFFELGGHSLLITQVHSKLREIYGNTISMVDLFTYPTIQSLASHMGQNADGQPAAQEDSAADEKLRKGSDRLKQQFKHRQRLRES